MSASAGTADSARPLSRSFHFFLWTRMLSTAANQILLVALGWQMYDLTGSAWDLGLVGLLQFVPTVAFTIPSGHLADRADRRRVISAAIAVMLVAAALLAWGSVGHWIGRYHILGVSVLLGLARALLTPAQQAIVPTLVPSGQLPRAMALSSAAMKVAVVAGPALGGFIYAVGPAWAYGLCLVFLVAAIACVLSIHHVPHVHGSASPTLRSMFAGFGFIF
ncbi:MAG TPA: MFS transporter, partial [Usitatibacter sp.]